MTGNAIDRCERHEVGVSYVGCQRTKRTISEVVSVRSGCRCYYVSAAPGHLRETIKALRIADSFSLRISIKRYDYICDTHASDISASPADTSRKSPLKSYRACAERCNCDLVIPACERKESYATSAEERG